MNGQAQPTPGVPFLFLAEGGSGPVTARAGMSRGEIVYNGIQALDAFLLIGERKLCVSACLFGFF